MKRSARGFTLIETLVVLAILGALAGAAVLAVGAADRGALAETEANRLADRLQLAADEALVTGDTLQFEWDEDGYRFLLPASRTEWAPHPAEMLGPRYDLPGGLMLAAAEDLPLLVQPDGTGGARVFTIADDVRQWTVHFDGLSPAVENAR